MRPTREQFDAFLAHQPVVGVFLKHNEYVQVISGEHAGDAGSLVSIEELGDDPVDLVELESSQDALVPQSCLRVIAAR